MSSAGIVPGFDYSGLPRNVDKLALARKGLVS